MEDDDSCQLHLKLEGRICSDGLGKHEADAICKMFGHGEANKIIDSM